MAGTRLEVVGRSDPVTGDPAALSPVVRAARAAMPVALVSMPFVSAYRPSIQLGLLKPIAESHGFPAETFHLNLEFARQIGVSVYECLSHYRRSLLGDWLFSVAAFGDDAPDPIGEFAAEAVEELPKAMVDSGLTHERLLEIRETEIPRYIKRSVDSIDWSRFEIVGFTSTFQQSVASFALARAIKSRWPRITTLFGGANFDGSMGRELVRTVDAIDFAISGEADITFSRFLLVLSDGGDPATVPGVLMRGGTRVVDGGTPRLLDRLDELPVPDYGEFFDRAERLGIFDRAGRRAIHVPYESARGCWWGAKRHCTFCGLNGDTMAFRAKSPQKVLDELAVLSERYGTFAFAAVDNILEPSYVDGLLPELSTSRTSYDLFYEVKANLSRGQLRRMRAAGVRHLQPGIESLSSRVLGLMRKGTRASTNVNFLRWASHYAIEVSWNVLWGFPGEKLKDYREQADLMRSLMHLPPPGSGGRISMERFSPIFSDRESFPAIRVAADRSYRYIYPQSTALDEVAYFFDYELEGTLPDEAYDETAEVLTTWREAWRREIAPALWLWQSPGFVQIDDTRDEAGPATHTFEGLLAELYMACFDQPRKASDAASHASVPCSPGDAEAALDAFVAQRLMMRDGNLFLALALPAGGAYGELAP